MPTDDANGLPTQLLTPVKELWTHLQAEADDAIYSYKQEYDATIKEMRQELNHYKAKDTEWQGRVHALEEKLHQQGEDNKRLNAELIVERQERIKTSERVQALQARQQENEAEKERLHQLLKHVQANLQHYQEATQQLRLEQEMIVEKQRAGYEKKLSQLQQQMEVMIREKTFLEARCASLDSDYKNSLAREAAVTEEVVQLRQEYIALEVKYDTIEQDRAATSEELIAQHQVLEARNGELVECRLKLEMADTRIASLENALSAAESKIMTLRDDYIFATQAKANLEGQIKQLREGLPVST